MKRQSQILLIKMEMKCSKPVALKRVIEKIYPFFKGKNSKAKLMTKDQFEVYQELWGEYA